MICVIRPIYRKCRLSRGLTTKSDLYQECYSILNLSIDADQETVRTAYIELVKKVHPDSGHTDASADRFQQVDNAFRVLQAKFAKERRNIHDGDERASTEEIKKFDIRHTAPQHRQYLSFDGIGNGTPSQREKQYQQHRTNKAHENIMEYRLEKAIACNENDVMKSGAFFRKHAIKTKYGFDRVVEDLIQEAMSKGEFSNLAGNGKPLSQAQTQNPYLDFTAHKINKILIDNGFTPEWITLQKDIRTAIGDVEESLKTARAYLGPMPITDSETDEWNVILGQHQHKMDEINRMIDKYNMIVPILQNQIIRNDIRRIGEKILRIDPTTLERVEPIKKENPVHCTNSNQGLLSFLTSWLC